MVIKLAMIVSRQEKTEMNCIKSADMAFRLFIYNTKTYRPQLRLQFNLFLLNLHFIITYFIK
jgi:hypothetical protein